MKFEAFEFLSTLSIDEARTGATAKAIVPLQNSIFDHHFPDNPMFPGAYQIETAAQSAGYLCLVHTHWERMPFLMAVDKARFRKPIPPGTHIGIRTKIVHLGSSYCAVESRLEQEDGACFANIEVRLRFSAFPSDEMKRYTMEKFLKVIEPGAAQEEVFNHPMRSVPIDLLRNGRDAE